jgi:CDP-glucose 4,6-dehydratase
MEVNFWKNKRVFITGHTGFKGSWLSIWLNMLGAEVTGYALKPPTTPSLFKLSGIENEINSVINDIRDYDALLNAIKKYSPEIMIHMAAQPLVRRSYADPIETFEVNGMGTANILEAIRNVKGIKAVVNVTTDKVYENKESLTGYKETDPLGGYDPYSASKAVSEIITASYRRSFFDTSKTGIATARAGNVIGGGDWGADRLVPDFIRSILKEQKLFIRYPKAVRPWQHVLEPLSGYMMLAERLYSNGNKYSGPFNFGPDKKDTKTVEWLVKTLCVNWGMGASYAVDKKKHPHETTLLTLDNTRSKKLLGWRPRLSVEQALNMTIEWTKAYKNKENMLKVCKEQIREYTVS